ncbi:MAG TPA: hypothetical protein DCL77_19950 [Prolixibacteraceae bacterium]|jgi:DNA-binding Lrp family transcriptional regulator|nr:hypothetical protein [Prolixibacteraceae bacterium]
MSRKKAIDSIDIEILNILQKDGRVSNREIAAQIGLSEGPTLTRVHKLIEKGVIETMSVVDLSFLNLKYQTFIEVKITEDHKDEFVEKALQLPGLLTLTRLERQVQETYGTKYNTLTLSFAHASEKAFEKTAIQFIRDVNYPVEYQVFKIMENIKSVPTINIMEGDLK